MEFAQRQQLLNAATSTASRSTFQTNAPTSAATNTKKILTSGTQSLLAKGVTHSDVLIKRVEYLETVVKNMKDQMLGIEVKHSQLTDALVTQQSMNIEHQDTSSIQAQVKDVFESSQTVYGSVVKSAPFLRCDPDADVDEELRTNAISAIDVQSWEAMDAGTCILLVYPMRMIEVSDGASYVFMKCKNVDEETAQVSLSWVALHHTDTEGTTTPFVSNFRLFPHAGNDFGEKKNMLKTDRDESTILIE
eukprot:6180082-Pleurochrysis_carterae.AAC.2